MKHFQECLDSVVNAKHETTIIYMSSDLKNRSGWTARLICIFALYRIAKDNGFDFKISFTEPYFRRGLIRAKKIETKGD